MGKVFLVDTSGSMAEEGKKSVVRYLLYAIENIMRDEYPEVNYGVFLWSESVSVYDKKMDFGGRAEAKPLSLFLEEHKADTVMLIGDGSYSENIKRVIMNAGRDVLALMVGSDCNRARLQRMVGAGRVYESVDVSTCIRDFVNMP